MKYSELERRLLKFGCYSIEVQQCGHPLWFSPITGKTFMTSNHKSREIATGTLKKILRDAGISGN